MPSATPFAPVRCPVFCPPVGALPGVLSACLSAQDHEKIWTREAKTSLCLVFCPPVYRRARVAVALCVCVCEWCFVNCVRVWVRVLVPASTLTCACLRACDVSKPAAFDVCVDAAHARIMQQPCSRNNLQMSSTIIPPPLPRPLPPPPSFLPSPPGR